MYNYLFEENKCVIYKRRIADLVFTDTHCSQIYRCSNNIEFYISKSNDVTGSRLLYSSPFICWIFLNVYCLYDIPL